MHEVESVAMFAQDGCSCNLGAGDSPCCRDFSVDHYNEMRCWCAEMTREKRDLVLKAQIMAMTNRSTLTQHTLCYFCSTHTSLLLLNTHFVTFVQHTLCYFCSAHTLLLLLNTHFVTFVQHCCNVYDKIKRQIEHNTMIMIIVTVAAKSWGISQCILRSEEPQGGPQGGSTSSTPKNFQLTPSPLWS